MKKLIHFTLILISLVLFPASSALSAVLLDRVVATVNNEVITWSELRNSIERQIGEQFQGLTAEEREGKIKELRSRFLDSMIDFKLQVQEAERSGLRVNTPEIDNAINDVKKKYNLTDEILVDSLRAEGLTMAEYMKQLVDQILLSKVIRLKVNDRIYIKDAQVEKYYETHKEKFHLQDKIRIRQIFFARPEDDALISSVEKGAYDVIRRLEQGEDFSIIAMELSEDASREFGGDLGYVTRGSVLKEIEDVAFDLLPGEISSPFWSASGLHIVKLEEREESISVGKVRDEIKDILFKETFNIKYDDWLKSLREKAYIEIKL
jgi:peptidyl-prolyl cis-trans isomerase SurA